MEFFCTVTKDAVHTCGTGKKLQATADKTLLLVLRHKYTTLNELRCVVEYKIRRTFAQALRGLSVIAKLHVNNKVQLSLTNPRRHAMILQSTRGLSKNSEVSMCNE